MKLDELIQNSKDSWQSRAWVEHNGFKSMYVRVTKRYINGNLIDTIDIANIEAEHPGNGAFRNLILHLTNSWPQYIIYVESVLEDRFRQGLLRMGFKQVENIFNYYLPHESSLNVRANQHHC